MRKFLGFFMTVFLVACKTANHDADLKASAVGQVTQEEVGAYYVVQVKYDANAPWVVYLHGYGGTGEKFYSTYFNDMVARNPKLKQVNWLFPSGSWFNIETEDFRIWQETLIPTRKKLKNLLHTLKIDPTKVIWSGFSQGAITAVDYVLHDTQKSLGLIINSGMYFDSTDWKRNAPHLKGMRFYLVHGVDDDIFEFSFAEKLGKLLRDNGMIGRVTKKIDGHNEFPDFLGESALKLAHAE